MVLHAQYWCGMVICMTRRNSSNRRSSVFILQSRGLSLGIPRPLHLVVCKCTECCAVQISTEIFGSVAAHWSTLIYCPSLLSLKQAGMRKFSNQTLSSLLKILLSYIFTSVNFCQLFPTCLLQSTLFATWDHLGKLT